MKNTLLLLLFLAICAPAWAQVQLGDDIEGEGIWDETGYAITLSADGTRLAVSATRLGGGDLSLAGKVRIFQLTNNQWQPLGAAIEGSVPNLLLGFAVAFSADGNRLAVGLPGYDGPQSNEGGVQVYEWSGTVWEALGDLIPGELSGDEAGRAVALSADGYRVAIGSRGNDENGALAGQVRVFEYKDGFWIQLGGNINGPGMFASFGQSVALSADGTRLAVGSSFINGYQGQLQVFDFQGATWTPVGDPIEGESGSGLGHSIAISADGDYLLAGAPETTTHGAHSGAARVFHIQNGQWQQLGETLLGDGEEDRFGWSVDITANGQRIACGANQDQEGAPSMSGYVRVFDWNGDAWVPAIADLIGENPGDQYGCAVSLSSVGTTLAIGGIKNDGVDYNAGHTQAFALAPVAVAPSVTTSPLQLFPNPTSGAVQLSGLTGASWPIRIYDSEGRLVATRQLTEPALELSQLPAGAYTLRIQMEGRWQTLPFHKY
ncbi:MAG: T9SS type A sorting domain-containing protein [Lewinella sp.]|nr:T9SS type A sorting domain-containing protein [Lewinella sp.]